MNIVKHILFTLIVFSLAACSPATTQPAVPGTTTTPPPSISAASPSLSITTTLLPPSITTIPESTETLTEPEAETILEISQYGLSGRLVLIQYNQKGNKLIELDLATGEMRTLFQAPEKSWLSEAVVSPDHTQILMAYAPPPPEGETQFGYTDLYILPYDGSSPPRPFLTRSDTQEAFFFSTWDADGQSIYFTHLYRLDPNSEIPTYQNDIEKATLGGEVETIVEHALWPAISPDGTKLSYLYAEPGSFTNDLYLANPDGIDQVPVLQPGANPPVDAHLFTMDGSQLIFSMVNAQPAPASSWLEKIFGVEVASAHNVPSDWYRAPLSGGIPERLTSVNDVNLNGDLSPDGSQFAFIGSSGLYFMNVDGSDISLLSDMILVGTVNWLP